MCLGAVRAIFFNGLVVSLQRAPAVPSTSGMFPRVRSDVQAAMRQGSRVIRQVDV